MAIALGIAGLHLKGPGAANSHHMRLRLVGLIGRIDGKGSIGSILVDRPLVARRLIAVSCEDHRITSLQWDTLLLELGLESITNVA